MNVIQLLSAIIFFIVFIQLFVALSIYLYVTIRNYLKEESQKRISHSISFADVAGVVAASPNATIIINQLGIIVQANALARELFGYPDLVGKIVDTLLPQTLREGHARHRARYFADPRIRPMGAHLTLYGLHANGTVFPIEVSLSPLTIESQKHALAILVKKESEDRT